jgi:hypothetical protein
VDVLDDLKILLIVLVSLWVGGSPFGLHSPTNITRLLKESPSASSRSIALFSSSLTTPSGLPVSGATCLWEPNLSAWLNLIASGILSVKKSKPYANARRWASFPSTRADETAIRPPIFRTIIVIHFISRFLRHTCTSRKYVHFRPVLNFRLTVLGDADFGASE